MIYTRSGRVESLPGEWANSLSWRLGVRPFTSTRIEADGPLLWKYHRRRLDDSLQLFSRLGRKQRDHLFIEIKQCLEDVAPGHRARVDLILLNESTVDWLITVTALGELKKEVPISLTSMEFKTPRPFERVKEATYIPEYLWQQKNSELEPLFEDSKHGVLESMSSNVFFVSNSEITLPAQTRGVLKGVYLEAFKDFLENKGVILKESDLFYNQLAPTGIFVLCNSVKGFRRCYRESSKMDEHQHDQWEWLLTLECEFLNVR